MTRIAEYPAGDLAALLPRLAPDANKYTRGKVIFVGGCTRYAGAACLACEAAARMGAGYVEAHCSEDAVVALHVRIPSVVALRWDGSICGRLKGSPHPRSCLVGPGMDAADRAQMELVQSVLDSCEPALVVDGGALAQAASESGREALRARAGQGRATVLTPHGGEAARLAQAASLAAPADGADEQQLAAFALDLARAYGATVLLKGPVSFVACAPQAARPPDRRPVYAMRRGTPALAKAGTGDVLAGMVASLLAQGLEAPDACILAAALHAEAARAAAERLGEAAVCAEDVLAAIPQAIRVL